LGKTLPNCYWWHITGFYASKNFAAALSGWRFYFNDDIGQMRGLGIEQNA